ncbi:MAG: hypothetical protein KDA84_18510, partial [Planctomycetaceae bacterium]|nr:hypothetical protein [Planctomycetaceae bacterium]
EVTNSGSDQGKLAPMVDQHEERYDQTPEKMLVDGGFVKKADITKVSEPNGQTTVYAPVPTPCCYAQIGFSTGGMRGDRQEWQSLTVWDL